jgi:hypothetical protein
MVYGVSEGGRGGLTRGVSPPRVPSPMGARSTRRHAECEARGPLPFPLPHLVVGRVLEVDVSGYKRLPI